MYYCDNCDSFFDEPAAEREMMGYYGSAPAYQDFAVCPYCKSDDFEEAKVCEICGEPFIEDDLHDRVCSFCLDDMVDIEEEADEVVADKL